MGSVTIERSGPTHLRLGELPGGRPIVRLSHHLAPVIEGDLHDTHHCGRGGTRCVYGYRTRSNKQ